MTRAPTLAADAPRLIEFDTPRLRLRQWRASDVAAFTALNADPRVMEFFPELMRPSESRAMARKIRGLIRERGWGLWAVEVLAGARFIGFVGLHVPAAALPCSPCVEVGWRLAPAHWGCGYATEAARGVLAVGFETLGLDEIVSFTAGPNLRSQAVMQRLGMTPRGEFDHPEVPPGSPLRRHVLYVMRRDQWLARDEDLR